MALLENNSKYSNLVMTSASSSVPIKATNFSLTEALPFGKNDDNKSVYVNVFAFLILYVSSVKPNFTNTFHALQ